MPTGLTVGKTLFTFDLVGRDRHHQRISAQCKKDLNPRPLEENFLSAARQSIPGERYFYFAYGGSATEIPSTVKVFTKKDIKHWLENEPQGQMYLELLRS